MIYKALHRKLNIEPHEHDILAAGR